MDDRPVSPVPVPGQKPLDPSELPVDTREGVPTDTGVPGESGDGDEAPRPGDPSPQPGFPDPIT